ncbi:MAG: NUDIX hydrolase [Candidatus Thermoplasmatota archaeon]|jgi:8-oxo-dGTP diphosphatase|nr:NUDIX hydrolase [Candidatus Thermoplasmatota archaeon]
MWTYCIAFTDDRTRFLMVRSRKRGGWEMPGGGMEPDETPVASAKREFMEETGSILHTSDDLSVNLGTGRVFFGTIGPKVGIRREGEITDVALFERLPDGLAYPQEEYLPLIEKGREMLKRNSNGII